MGTSITTSTHTEGPTKGPTKAPAKASIPTKAAVPAKGFNSTKVPTSASVQKKTTIQTTIPARPKANNVTTTSAAGGGRTDPPQTTTKSSGNSSPTGGSPKKTATTTSSTSVGNGSSSNEGGAPPPPPPPPPPAHAPAPVIPASTQPYLTVPHPILNTPRPGSLLVSLAIYNGRPFKDHWVFFIRRTATDQIGIMVHAAGSVRTGFALEVKRNYDFLETSTTPPDLVDLRWVDGRFFNQVMWNNGNYIVEKPGVPACPFETSAARAPAPIKSLNAVEDRAPTPARPTRITQRNCQTWIVEAGEMLVEDQIFPQSVLDYLMAIKQ
ncbi:hypothetical protein B0T21DRAFT_297310 [Apiosordaria backusii]|uniref:Uncharacterized protein n=1 Tax=Apiosordaria backusii TaxID=314023 RepID=A0AA40DWK3_9PEZI|nr:hypothetical protein B0T21DRAFT_297310 [Apiosordaria backusii]